METETGMGKRNIERETSEREIERQRENKTEREAGLGKRNIERETV